jgi:hypothetical protein
MEVLTPGHRYKLNGFYGDNIQELQFIHKEPVPESSIGVMKIVSDGTTNEELLEVLIDRIKFLNSKFACKENDEALTKLEEALMWLEKRTADRKKRGVEGSNKA